MDSKCWRCHGDVTVIRTSTSDGMVIQPCDKCIDDAYDRGYDDARKQSIVIFEEEWAKMMKKIIL